MKKIKENKFWLLVPLAIVFAIGVLFASGRQALDQRTCGCIPEAVLKGQFDDQEAAAFFESQPVAYPAAQLAALNFQPAKVPILGVSDDDRWVEIDLSEQKLYAKEAGRVVYEFLISSGKPWTPTQTGEFRIWIKLRYAKMSGGSKALGTYYYLPNVPYIQYYDGDYGLHGAYWHNNFGNQMSHGCVNLSIPDAEKLFYWTRPVLPPGKGLVYASTQNPGTRVIIHD
jgi:lipoprotein-anchoring transpeptidase ErfK/SrfK